MDEQLRANACSESASDSHCTSESASESAPEPGRLLPMSADELENYKLHRRFDRMGRLVGDRNMKRLRDAHVMIVGLGGVGSWAAESVVRSGVGEVTLIDFDEICVTNFNRQIHALNRLVGSQKSEVMADRVRQVNPGLKVNALTQFYNAESSEDIFKRKPDFVIDAIDNVTAKCHLIATCRDRKIPLVVSTGSGGRLDPTKVKMVDLAFTHTDPLARTLRYVLREKYNFPTNDKEPFGVPAVFSDEAATDPVELHYDQGKGFRCVCPQGDNPYFTCDKRSVIMGNASFVTGTFGFVCASTAVRHLLA